MADVRAKKVETDDDRDDLQAQVEALSAQVQALLKAQTTTGGLTDEKLEAILSRVAQVSADAQERAANPSNKTHPGISVFSYPEGDRARPRPDLKCEMFWVGYPIEKDTTTAEELELLNLAEPGTYQFLRTDGRPEQLKVIASDRHADGTPSKLLFDFLVKENRETLPSMADMLRKAFRVKSPQEIELDRLRAEIETLRTAKVVA